LFVLLFCLLENGTAAAGIDVAIVAAIAVAALAVPIVNAGLVSVNAVAAVVAGLVTGFVVSPSPSQSSSFIVVAHHRCPLFRFLLLFYHSATQVSNFFHTRVCQAAQSSLLSHLALKSQASNPGECSGCLTRLANSSGVGTN